MRTAADGTQTTQPTYQCDSSTAACVSIPIDLSSSTDSLTLLLSATGVRNRSDISELNVTIGGTSVPAVSAAAQSDGAPGMDTITVMLPQSLTGAGEVQVQVFVDGKAANVVQLSFL